MNRDLPRKIISLPNNLQSTKTKSNKFRTRKKKPFYRLTGKISPNDTYSVKNTENKENKGVKHNPISNKPKNNENVKRNFLKDISNNDFKDNNMKFVLKSNEVKYEERSIFDNFELNHKNNYQTPKLKNQNNLEIDKADINCFTKNTHDGFDELLLEKTAKNKRYGEIDNCDKRVSLQSKKTRGSMNILSEENKIQEKKTLEDKNVPDFLNDSLNTSSDNLNLFCKNSELFYESGNLNSTQSQKELQIRSNDQEKSNLDESEMYFIKPICDVIKESKNTDVYLDEGFLTECQMTNPFKTLTLDQNISLNMDVESDKKMGSGVNSESLDVLNNDLKSLKIESKSCFLDDDVEKSPIKNKNPLKVKKKVKKVMSLKEKFKKLTKMKKLNKENQAKKKIISQPFHPVIKKQATNSQNMAYVMTPSNYYYNNYMHGNIYNGTHDMDNFSNSMAKFNMMRMSFQGKSKHEMGYYRKDFRYNKSSNYSTEKGEEYSNKYKTEICKNFELTGKCQWGEMVRI